VNICPFFQAREVVSECLVKFLITEDLDIVHLLNQDIFRLLIT
jgi:hypothetical protein